MEDFEPGPGWAEKTGFAPGVPEDDVAIPVVRYQALMGNVYTLVRWQDGSTVRGEVPLAELVALVSGPVREGWYDAAGAYLGASISLE
jgi:hypothetical protein